jgi:hypothetical protein
MNNKYQVYFGGDLFDHKDLMGNALLASYIEKTSEGRYTCFLPQTLDQADATALDIRNKDLIKIIECDLALFNFDGAEIDAGTVIEYAYAKFLDVPSVILRSDFRSSGEKDVGGDDWNLMCSFYPRTRIVQFSAIAFHQEAMNASGTLSEAMELLYTRIASLLIENFDAIIKEKPVFKGDNKELEAMYRWALEFPGGDLEKLCPGPVEQIIRSKKQKGLI